MVNGTPAFKWHPHHHKPERRDRWARGGCWVRKRGQKGKKPISFSKSRRGGGAPPSPKEKTQKGDMPGLENQSNCCRGVGDGTVSLFNTKKAPAETAEQKHGGKDGKRKTGNFES